MFSSLTERRLVGELMDDPALDVGAHRRALVGLGRIHRLSGTVGRLWRHLREMVWVEQRGIRVLEIGTGGGDVLVGLARRAAFERMPIKFTATDMSEQALARAERLWYRHGLAEKQVRFEKLDVLADAVPDEADVVFCSLFMHHFSDEQAGVIVRKMVDAARRKVLIDDLRRTRRGLVAAATVPRLLTRSKVVHVDAVRSVRAAFRMGEFEAICREAGVNDVVIEPVWPARFLMTWSHA
jgi:2-polyprenyl-3-methyl-5-hydroxy-6-metoxy-1,4-benzoquinol methylase